MNFILSILQNDLSQAKLNSFQNPDGSNISIEVNHRGNNGKVVTKKLKYIFNPPRLTRAFNDKAWIIAQNLEKLVVSKTATGQVLIEAKAKVKLEGMLPSETQTFSQNQVVTLREDMASLNDPHWRGVGEIEGVFDSHDDLMNGVKEDMTAIVQDMHGSLDSMLADVKAATAEKIEEMRSKMAGNLVKIKTHLDQLDEQILSMNWRAVVPPYWYGLNVWPPTVAKGLRKTLANMKTAHDLDWEVVKSASCGLEIKDSFQSLYKAKKDLFDAGKDIIDAAKELKIDLKNTGGVDTNIFTP
ncbi:hypothetical protein HYY75_02385 [bacterium]|nr:hypothetical protein [bacterium]